MRSVTLLHHAASKYGVLGQMTQDLCAALKRVQISSVVRNLEEERPADLLPELEKDDPDCTWAINIIIGESLFYYPLGIPHVCLSVDAVTYSHEAAFTQPHLVSLFADKTSCDLFSRCSENPVQYFPHAIAKETLDAVREAPLIPLQDRPFDVTLIGSLIDHDAEREFWNTIFSTSDVNAFISLAERALDDARFEFLVEALTYIEQTPRVKEVLKAKDLSPFSVVNSIERYARGLDRERLLQALQERDVHIFTLEEEAIRWAKKDSAKRCHFHPPVPFSEVINVCRMSKVVLQSVPTIRNGYHERLFLALASGAVTLVNAGLPLPAWLMKSGRVLEYESFSLDGLLSSISEVEKRPFDSKKILSWLEEEHSWDARLRQHLPQIEKSVKKLHELWESNPFWQLMN